ncbi:PAS domain S-box protein [bacterium]|nr:PAS domain S-box protein [bacterium]
MEKQRNNHLDYNAIYSIIVESDQADSILDLMKKNINLVVDFYDLDGGAIYLLEDDSANLFLNFNLSPFFVKNFNIVDKRSFVFKEVFKHKSPFSVAGKLRNKFKENYVDYQTMIIVPIFYDKKPIGFYLVASDREKGFEQRDVKLMTLIAKEIGSFVDQVISDVSIKKERQNFKSFFDLLQDIIIVVNSKGEILESNSFALNRLGYDKDFFVKKNIIDFFEVDKGLNIDEVFNQLVNNSTLLLSIIGKNKQAIPVKINSIKGLWNEKEAFFLTANDLSGTKEAEKKLQENKELYHSLVSNIPNYILIYNKNNEVLYANENISNALKISKQKILGQDIWKFIESNSREVLKSEIRNKFLCNDNLSNCEIRLLCSDKTLLDVIASGATVKYDGSDSFLLVMTDITNRKKMENLLIEKTTDLEASQKSLVNVLEDVEEEKNKAASLAQDLEKFKLAVENASDHIVITDSQGILLYINPGAEKITGFSSKEVIGKKCGSADNWGGIMDKAFYKKLWKIIKINKETFSGEIRNRRKDGSSYIAMANIFPILDNKENVLFFVGIERDITKEKEVDKAKSEFVSLASHQLRTPLSIVNWYVEMLINGDAGPLTDGQKDYLSEILIGNNRMVDLVGSLLNVSRIEMGTFIINPVKCNLIKIVKDVANEFEIKAKLKEIDFTLKYSKNIPLISLDKKLFNIIITNLIDNAIKYTPNGGKVTLDVSKDKKEIMIKIIDNGYGILKKDREKIFTKLFRGENAKEKVSDGNGLGLYIVKSIIEQSSGKIWFDSKENKGTTFYVTLPLSGMKRKKGEKELS